MKTLFGTKQFLVMVLFVALVSVLSVWAVEESAIGQEFKDSYLSRQQEPITELFFTNHLDLPKNIEPEKEYMFEFTIRNKEQFVQTYSYRVVSVSDRKSEVLSTDDISLQDGDARVVSVRFRIPHIDSATKITIDLLDRPQQIHFWATPLSS